MDNRNRNGCTLETIIDSSYVFVEKLMEQSVYLENAKKKIKKWRKFSNM
jgi:hypothetical protein